MLPNITRPCATSSAVIAGRNESSNLQEGREAMRRPHESPDCHCAGCTEWDNPQTWEKEIQEQIDAMWDYQLKKFNMLLYRSGTCEPPPES